MLFNGKKEIGQREVREKVAQNSIKYLSTGREAGKNKIKIHGGIKHGTYNQ